jgi:hypothetical protein
MGDNFVKVTARPLDTQAQNSNFLESGFTDFDEIVHRGNGPI